MKRTMLTVALVLGLAIAVSAQEKFEVAGGWTLTIEGPQGEIPISLKFEVADGEKITGKLFTPQGDLPISGKLAGKDIAFTGTFQSPNGSLEISFSGALENSDAMSGTADFGGFGTGKWSAKRAK